MIVLGIDAALCNLGLAAVELAASREHLVEVMVARTEPSPKKRRVRAIDDDARRVAELVVALERFIDRHRPAALAVEATGAGKGSKAVRAMALVFGAVVAVAKVRGLPLVQASPTDVKLAIAGRKDASKDDVVAAVVKRFPGVAFQGPRGVWEHQADAVGAVVACLDADVMRLARQFGAQRLARVSGLMVEAELALGAR
jgi:crossover junction endodeoxyribonuclease RuvC